MSNSLDFEQPIVDLEAKIDELRRVDVDGALDLHREIERLETKSHKLTREIFASLDAWQITQLARHPQRPHTLDYISRVFSNFQELSGDRMYRDDPAIVGGLARVGGKGVMVIGHQKGRDTKEKVRRNFGMPSPEGYRKAQRLMRIAEKFRLPVITLIDTPGAYPGIGAEERGQSEAIAQNIAMMAGLKVPIVSIVIGEGGSGGALAIGVCDHLNMLEYATYSVISPEGCASILWKTAEKAADAAQAMGITSRQLFDHGLVETVIDEPLGGAHRDHQAMAAALKTQLQANLEQYSAMSIDDLLAKRYDRLMSFGRFDD